MTEPMTEPLSYPPMTFENWKRLIDRVDKLEKVIEARAEDTDSVTQELTTYIDDLKQRIDKLPKEDQ